MQKILRLTLVLLILASGSGCSWRSPGSANTPGSSGSADALGNSEYDSGARLEPIGDVRGDGPPRVIDYDRLATADAIVRREARSRTGNNTYVIAGRRFTPLKSAAGYRGNGMASWYGKKFHGRRTSSGEPYDMYAMTAAHRILPIPSYAKVTNLDNGRSVVVKVNDRGPFRGDRLIDLSYAAARKIGAEEAGTVNVSVESLQPGPHAKTGLSGPNGQSTTLEASPGDAAESASSGVSLQAGAFLDPANAESLKGRLIGSGFKPVKVSHFPHRDGFIYRVRIGPLVGLKAATMMNVRLSEQLGITGRLVYD